MLRWSRLLQPNAVKFTSLSSRLAEVSGPKLRPQPVGVSVLAPRHRPFSLLPTTGKNKKPKQASPSVGILPGASSSDSPTVDILDLQFEAATEPEIKSSTKETKKEGWWKEEEAKKQKCITVKSGKEVPKKEKKGKGGGKKKKSTSKQTPLAEEKKTSTVQQKTPSQQLQAWYGTHHDVEFKDTCITMKMVDVVSDGKGMLHKWKAQFKCPITKEIFLSGILANMEKEAMRVEGDIVYNKLKHAREAAQARALDCFRFREGEQAATERICVEVPYKFGETPVVTVEEEVVNEAEESEEEEVELGSDEDDDFDSVISDDDEEEDEDEEEYTIQYLSGTSPNETSQYAATNPMARVIGSWSNKTTTALQKQTDAVASFLATDPEQELKQLIKNAQDWVEKEQASKRQWSASGNQHRVLLQGSDFRSLDIANTMLEGLAKAHRRLTFQSGFRGVDQVATSILNHLWSTRSTHPNANTYVAYLGCMEGQDQLSVAKRAKEIMDKMKEGATVDPGGEKPFPKPTIEVVNAVIQLWAQVGGESGRNLQLDNIKEKSNRETYLSLLSSMSYPPTVEGESGFDPIFAQGILDKMKEAALSLDTSDYNAGLRWSGGMQSTLSRPHMRPIAWDVHAEIFQNGFEPYDEDSAAVQEAYRMNAWLEEMGSEGDTPAPNIETYEAVIQAYVRTGSLDGVQQAEKILESLLDPSSSDQMPTPRLQTFHPIIAAWAHAGHEQSALKVNKWIDQLRSLSNGKRQSQEFDCAVAEAPLLANANGVVRALRSEKEFASLEMDDLVNTSLGCSIHLKELCSGVQNHESGEGSPLLDAQLFALVVQAWGNLRVRLQHTTKKPEAANQALEKMHETVDEYENFLMYSLRNKRGKQARNLKSNAHKVYSVFISTLQDAATLSKTSDSAWSVDQHISSFETWVRRLSEIGDIQSIETTLANDRVYGDMYSYVAGSSSLEGCAENQAEFLMQILGFLRDNIEDPVASPMRGDMVRLCFLIVDVMPLANKNSASANMHGTRPFSLVSGHTEVIKTMCHLASGPEERDALLGRLLFKADWMLQEQICTKSDHNLMVKEIRKHSSSIPARRPGRPRTMRRDARSSLQQIPLEVVDPDVDGKSKRPLSIVQ